MRSNFSRLILVLAIMSLPALPGPLMVRIGILLVCLSCAVALGARWYLRSGQEEWSRQAGRPGQGETVHRLSQQLREVVQQTEDAALEINVRVINIISRARAQLQAVTEVATGLCREGDGAGPKRDVAQMIESMDAETASLSQDVNSVIQSLQFQDLTKQRLEQVIDELQRLHGELELLKAHPGDTGQALHQSSLPVARSGRPEVSGAQGRSDG